MNKYVVLAITLIILLFSESAEARNKKPKMRLFRTKRELNSAAITVASSKGFIVGRKIYVLYIGGRTFYESQEDVSDAHKHRMTFYIPLDEYNALRKNSRMFLTYGYVYDDKVDEEQMELVCKANRIRCWSLGRFRKKRLS